MTDEKEKTQIPEVNTTVISKENPLIIDRLSRRVDGGIDIVLGLSKEQTFFLLDYAIMALCSLGLARVVDSMDLSEESKPDTQQSEDSQESPQETGPVTLGSQIH